MLCTFKHVTKIMLIGISDSRSMPSKGGYMNNTNSRYVDILRTSRVVNDRISGKKSETLV